MEEYNEALKKIYHTNNLLALCNFDLIKFGEENALGFLNIIKRTRAYVNGNGRFDLLVHDLIFSTSYDARFAIANALLYFPKANNYIKEVQSYPDGTQLPTYFRTSEDKKFFFYINCSLEKLYNHWDRVGDILALAFQLKIHERDVFFSKVIQNLKGRGLEDSEDFRWLENFHDTEYQRVLNYLRKKIVHDRQKDTYFYFEWIELIASGNCDLEKIEELQQEKEALLPMLRKQLDLTNIGFEKMVNLISKYGPLEPKKS